MTRKLYSKYPLSVNIIKRSKVYWGALMDGMLKSLPSFVRKSEICLNSFVALALVTPSRPDLYPRLYPNVDTNSGLYRGPY